MGYEELDYEDDRIAHIAKHDVDIEVYEVWEGNRLTSKWERNKMKIPEFTSLKEEE